MMSLCISDSVFVFVDALHPWPRVPFHLTITNQKESVSSLGDGKVVSMLNMRLSVIN